MGILRVLICLLFPPLAVLDKGCGVLLLVCVLTLFGWIPGVLAALIICLQQPPTPQQEARESLLGVVAAIVFVTTIALVAIGISVVAPRMMQKGQGWLNAQVENTARRSAIESAWQPPSLRPDATWFPAVVEKWTLQSSADISTLPELQLDRPGRRGKYRGEKQDVEVIVVPVSDLELDDVFNRAASALNAAGKHVIKGGSDHSSFHIETSSSQMTTRTQGRLYLRLSGDDHTRLWWMKDWLFVFRTVGPEDPDAFAEKYLEAMQPAELEKR